MVSTQPSDDADVKGVSKNPTYATTAVYSTTFSKPQSATTVKDSKSGGGNDVFAIFRC